MEDARRLAITRRRAFVTAQWKNRVKEPNKSRDTPLGDISCVLSDLVLVGALAGAHASSPGHIGYNLGKDAKRMAWCCRERGAGL